MPIHRSLLLLLPALMSFSFLPSSPDIKGFWLLCKDGNCESPKEDQPYGGLIFDDSICHVFIGTQTGLDPEILSSLKYEIRNDSLYTYEESKSFVYALNFLNDSTLQLSMDSIESSLFRRIK